MHAPTDDIVPTLPPNAPRVRPNRLARWLGRSLLRLGGWRLIGEFPDLPKLVLIGAPHSSNWDGIWAFSAKLALGLDIRILGKDSLFRVPVMGRVLHGLGVIPVDRSAPNGVVGQAATMLQAADRCWFGLAPEGTRKPVAHWRTGFWKIAHSAGVPVLPLYFHYPDKVMVVAPPVELSDDMVADIDRLRGWYRAVAKGKRHDA
ncbi:acyltransferase [Lysobacter concretionis Ko07 = DSM 16239]|uniref:Acyltransferase n=1 Tax=Lysobacter concretionis Ko07 = DSM 16239 TaxID=1122185 RepID=A0A0A0EJV5_9GAMM|nr:MULTISPECIES: 1-acyl-sn-glycerol-3-phosphate acyltransferase [Lysobacter]KGM51266.1 acyltransferase [Lysobacter concretionis Ko07 = DSM 16239]QOD90970.1 1-acyl-sn-glycerol-3-phosphate acyltransferase [Lysobacter sp. CW239]